MASSVHPIFDPSSGYRQMVRSSLASDGGQSRVRRFFEGLRRRDLHAMWMEQEVVAPQEWGFGEDANQAFHRHLRAVAELKSQTGHKSHPASRDHAMFLDEQPLAQSGRKSFPGGRKHESSREHVEAHSLPQSTPALLIYDLEQQPIEPTAPGPRREFAKHFGWSGRPDETIERFDLSADDLPTARQALAIILPPSILERLAVLVDPKTEAEVSAVGHFLAGKQPYPTRLPAGDNDAVAVVNAALDPGVLEPAREPTAGGASRVRYGLARSDQPVTPDPARDRRRAEAVNILLALAPAFTGSTRTTGPQGRFIASIALDNPSPIPELGTYILLCLGPPM